MEMLEIGTVVKTPNGELGWVRSEPTLTPVGEVVHVQFLPAFANTTASGWSDYKVDELTEAKVCGCATLGYIDPDSGTVVHTSCDVTRQPGKGRQFLPGHDAKAKGFLIRAWGTGGKMLGGFEHSLAAAWTFGDKISAKVAAGISLQQRKDAQQRWTTGESQATRAVMRNLQKSNGDAGHEPIGHSFGSRSNGTDLETFTNKAKAWLKDKSELRSSTIESADYTVAYEYFVTDAN